MGAGGLDPLPPENYKLYGFFFSEKAIGPGPSETLGNFSFLLNKPFDFCRIS